MIFNTENKLCKDHKISIILSWILRIFLISFGIYEILFGFPVYGIMILLVVFFVLLPSILTRKRIFVPYGLEILIFIVLALEYVVADSLGFYANFAYYDKFQHTVIPAIISIIILLMMYIGNRFSKFNANHLMIFIIVVLMTIGIGAVLEVSEYSYDHYIGPATNFYISQGSLTQGSPVMDPFADTMFDLIFDIIGAIIGALIGVFLLIKHEKDGTKWLLDEEIDIMEEYRKK